LISFTREVADRAIRLSARQRPRCLDALGRRALAATGLDRIAACSGTPFHFPARASSYRNRRDWQPGSAQKARQGRKLLARSAFFPLESIEFRTFRPRLGASKAGRPGEDRPPF